MRARRMGCGWKQLPALLLLCLVTACASQGPYTRVAPQREQASRYYPPPGPPNDPWGPYIREAASRFQMPEKWIRGVMRQESGGHEDAVSSAGAMGLMQVMPATYNILRRRYGLGDDPFDPHNNMLAGVAYLKEMYDRYGSPGFLAAYNAGPGRVDDYLATGNPLPDETVNYVASIAPRLGNEIAPSGPLAVYAMGGVPVIPARADGCDPNAAYDPTQPCRPAPKAPVVGAPVMMATAALPSLPATQDGCDPDAAYDPTRPCRPAPVSTRPVVMQPVAAPQVMVAAATPPSGPCDPDAAYDPTRPCRPAPQDATPVVLAAASNLPCDPDAAYDPSRPCRPMPAPASFAQPAVAVTQMPAPRLQLASAAAPMSRDPVARDPGWAIQVGAFADPATARAATTRARDVAPDLLSHARESMATTSPFGGAVLYRARLGALNAAQAAQSCARLSGFQLPCMVVPPSSGAGVRGS